MTNNLSPMEEIFGEDCNSKDLSEYVAILRDDYADLMLKYIPEGSIASSPECCLFAVHKLLKEIKENNEL